MYCRDRAEERVQSIIMVVSNADAGHLGATTTAAEPLQLVVTDNDCLGWQGSAQWDLHGEDANAEGSVTYTLAGSAQLTWTLIGAQLVGDRMALAFAPAAGNAAWSMVVDSRNAQGQSYHCERGGSAPLRPVEGQMLVEERLGSGHLDRRFEAWGVTPTSGTCPALESWTLLPWLQTGDGWRPWEGGNPGRLSGSYTTRTAISTITSTWQFTARTAP